MTKLTSLHSALDLKAWGKLLYSARSKMRCCKATKGKKEFDVSITIFVFPPLNVAAVDEMIQRDPEPLDAQDSRCT